MKTLVMVMLLVFLTGCGTVGYLWHGPLVDKDGHPVEPPRSHYYDN